MARQSNLEQRLADWAKEYAGSRYENIGMSTTSQLAQLMKYQGRPPQGLNPRRIEVDSPADIVEQAVRALGAQKGGEIPAFVIRCEYFARDAARAVRLQRLERVGYKMDTTRYSHHLRAAKIHVAAWLHIPFDEPLAEEASVEMLAYLVAEPHP